MSKGANVIEKDLKEPQNQQDAAVENSHRKVCLILLCGVEGSFVFYTIGPLIHSKFGTPALVGISLPKVRFPIPPDVLR